MHLKGAVCARRVSKGGQLRRRKGVEGGRNHGLNRKDDHIQYEKNHLSLKNMRRAEKGWKVSEALLYTCFNTN